VVGDGFKSAHKLLQQALNEDKIDLALIPNGILPIVDPRLAAQAVNSDRREDILIWRYKKEKLENLVRSQMLCWVLLRILCRPCAKGPCAWACFRIKQRNAACSGNRSWSSISQVKR